jgi:excinuclease UvrABC helicase subunit UvrB
VDEPNEPLKQSHIAISDLEKRIKDCDTEMRTASKEMRYEDAARARDMMRYYQNLEMLKADKD